MAKVFCKYHPNIPARWSCGQCRINFCTDCIQHGQPEPPPLCPVCGNAVASLGAANLIKPFWQRIPRFFLYPAHPAPLVFLIALSMLASLMAGGVFGLLLSFVIGIVFFKYAFEVMEDTAHGHLKPLPITSTVLMDELELPFKQIMLILVAFAVNFQVLGMFGRGAFSLTLFVSILFLPASIMVLAIEHSLLKALNPLLLIVAVKRIGFSYFILCFFLALQLAGSDVAAALVLPVLPEELRVGVSYFLSMYFLLIMYHMMGYVLYQYHEDLGFEIDAEYREGAGHTELSSDPRFRPIDILLQEGKVADAEQKLITMVAQHPGEFAAREKLHRLYIMTVNQAGLQKHSAEYIVRLLHDKKVTDALRVFIETYQVHPGFKLPTAKDRHELARLLKANGQARAALSQLENLHRDHPAYDGIPAAYLQVAEIMFDYFGDDEKARQVLEFLLQKYPGHPLRPNIEEYLQVIRRMSGK